MGTIGSPHYTDIRVKMIRVISALQCIMVIVAIPVIM